MRQSDSRESWEHETHFIEAQASSPNRMPAFKPYCDMQAKFAAQDGFPDLSERIKKAGEAS